MAATNIPNEVNLRKALAGTEVIPGDAVAPTFRWLGQFMASKEATLIRTPESTGGYDNLVTPRRGVPTYSGTYAESLTFESLPIHARYGLRAGGTGVADGDGFLHTKAAISTGDGIDSATVQYGVDGLGWRSTGVRHNEFTITVDTDDADGVWKWSSNLFLRDKVALPPLHTGTATGGTTTTVVQTGAAWTVNAWAGAFVFLDFGTGTGDVREIVSNTTDTVTFAPAVSGAVGAGTVFRIEGLFTAGIAFPNWESIPVPGTKIFLDPYNAGAPATGTTQIMDRFISANVTVATNRTGKRFAENVDSLSARTGRGGRIISGQIRLEFDRRDEYEQWDAIEQMSIRIESEGSALSGDPGDNKRARIDIPRAAWDTVTEDERENNITATFAFVAYLPASQPILTIQAKNGLSVLP